MRKFEFGKSYEEVEIAGKIYKIDFTDAKVKEYQFAIHDYYKEAQELRKVDVEKLTPEEQQEKFVEAMELQRKVIDIILGEGAFDELYEKSGESSQNMVALVEFLAEVIGERVQKLKQKQKNKYVRPKKNFHNHKSNHRRK